MGELFKVALAYKFKSNKFFGFNWCFTQKNLVI
jgi:hypothetical protein